MRDVAAPPEQPEQPVEQVVERLLLAVEHGAQQEHLLLGQLADLHGRGGPPLLDAVAHGQEEVHEEGLLDVLAGHVQQVQAEAGIPASRHGPEVGQGVARGLVVVVDGPRLHGDAAHETVVRNPDGRSRGQLSGLQDEPLHLVDHPAVRDGREPGPVRAVGRGRVLLPTVHDVRGLLVAAHGERASALQLQVDRSHGQALGQLAVLSRVDRVQEGEQVLLPAVVHGPAHGLVHLVPAESLHGLARRELEAAEHRVHAAHVVLGQMQLLQGAGREADVAAR